MNNKNILVTGAGGFIGRRVVATLLKNNFNVLAMVRGSLLPPFEPHENLRILNADITDYISFADNVKNIDVIVHLAANKYHPKLSYLVNIEGAKNIVKLISEKKMKGKRVINISSQSTKIKWKGVYGSSKYQSDLIIEKPMIEWTTIKPSLVYGADKNTLFQTIINYAKTLPVIPMIGNGKWELFPIDVNDLALAIVATINNPKSIHRVYDFGSKEKVTFDELVNLIQRQLQFKKPILHIPFLPGLFMVYLVTKIFPNLPISVDNVLGSNQNTSCDPRHAIKELDLKPISIKTGISKYIRTNKKSDIKKIAIVGMGKMGTLHATVLCSMDNVKIVALVDSDKKLAQTALSMGIKALFYRSLAEALKKETVDGVFICTPTFAHKEIIQDCIKNKIPFFVEKPVFNSFKNFNELKIDIKNKFNAAGYFWLFRREIEYTKKLLNDNYIGNITRYKIELKHSEVFGKKKGWLFNKKLSGGGVLMNPSPHAFSLVYYLFGRATISNAELIDLYGNGIEDRVNVKLEHPRGLQGILVADWSIKNYPVLTIEFKISGEKGFLEYKNNVFTLFRDGNKKILRIFEIPFPHSVYNLNSRSGGDAYYLEDYYFIKNLMDKKNKLINSIELAYEVESMINQSYEKAKWRT